MSAVVCFSGPSLTPRAAALLFPEALCLGPAAQGDVYRACVQQAQRPRAVCLIDGFFEHRPAVTHKELLWALHQGIPVYGAASLGALRAVELAPYGMRGWGEVYELYATGAVEDDDEVAIVHAPAAQDYRPGSDALVNIRRNLDAARLRGVVSRSACQRLIAHAKALFYPERSYRRLLTHAATFMPTHELEALEAWLANPARCSDTKQRDAETLLVHVRELWRSERLPTPRVRCEFAVTDAWVNITAPPSSALDGQPGLLAQLIEEVQLTGPEPFAEVIRVATWRAFCMTLQRDVTSPVRDAEALIDAAEPAAQRLVLEHVPGALQALGLHRGLYERAQHKLGRRVEDASLDAASIARYFERRLLRSMPQDLQAYAQSVGFDSAQELIAAIARDLEADA